MTTIAWIPFATLAVAVLTSTSAQATSPLHRPLALAAQSDDDDDDGADDDDDGAKAKPGQLRQTLVKNIPWIEAQIGPDHQADGQAIEREAPVKLDQATSHAPMIGRSGLV